MNDPEIARLYHEATEHILGRTGPGSPHLIEYDGPRADTRPAPFKEYRDLPSVVLPAWSASQRPAVDVLSTGSGGYGDLDLSSLARALFLSGGITRYVQREDRVAYFRAAPSAGGLNPIELYVACGRLPGLEAGLYHFHPHAFALVRIASGDARAGLAEAVGDPAVATNPATIVITGIPWRTAWNYRERGLRHVWWDSGSLLANLVAACDDMDLPTRVALGFVDAGVAAVLGLDSVHEFATAIVTIGGEPVPVGTDRSQVAVTQAASDGAVEFPLITRTQRGTELADVGAVRGWRGVSRPMADISAPADAPSDSLDDVVLRRGSTRRMAVRPVPRGVLDWAMAVASAPMPSDALDLLEHYLVVNAVGGVDAGTYRHEDGKLELLRAGDFREQAGRVCLGQHQSRDGAYAAFQLADLGFVLPALGSRGYRAAQIQAGYAMGRLHLAVFALGAGATGLTFFDRDVSALFDSTSAPMLAVAVGMPFYRAKPGGLPGNPTPIGDNAMRLWQERMREIGGMGE